MLDVSLTAEIAGDDVELALTVRNDGESELTLSFRDAQRAEFVATEAGTEPAGGENRETGSEEEEVWRWSDGRMFGMAVGSETLAPGAQTTYEATWTDVPPGTYEVRAWLTATDADASAETSVVVA